MNILSKLSIVIFCLLSVAACSKGDEESSTGGSRIKNFGNKEQVVAAVGTFVQGYTEGGINNTIFYMGEDYPTDIAGTYYNIPFNREAAGYRYSKEVMGRTTSTYESYEYVTSETAFKGYIEVLDNRLSNDAYSNVRIAKSPHNNDRSQTFIAHIDLKERYDKAQILMLHTIRSGFEGDPNNALPAVDDNTAVTHLLAQLEAL
ncbi:hypothetical protein [Sphingobacterium paludis]|uniref:Lipoprotein n=1 Tax=Sphingobacterium paludis TaxID=1476465 RepID=A0A4R7CUF1_9SPHI|nr:hypothetical protein [Sphingobacterium paludis]TDS11750.1 hypothetical protein B0I21_10793 [Sphingobacterium paludis]